MMNSRRLFVLALSFQFTLSGCAGCLGFGQSPDDDGRDGRGGEAPTFDGGPRDGGQTSNDRDASGGSESDGGSRTDGDSEADDAGGDDAGSDAGADAGGNGGDVSPGATCGDGLREGAESCDDGNTDDGDYCAGDCTAITGSCGDSTTQNNESCDDGNTDDGDYCAGDCSTITGSCGDGTEQSNENCDDGATADCVGTHDGGDGTCVGQGTCSAGYVLDNAGDCVQNPTGLTVPCQNGQGWTLFRFHWDSGSTSPRIDVWDATCSYSLASNSACNVRLVYPGFGDVDFTSSGYPILTTSEYMRVRFNVNGLNFTNATLHIRARSYATSSSTYYDVEAPLYGFKEGGPVDNDFVYDWYPLDWTGYLHPTDDPGLTAIQVYAGRGSGSMAVRAVEMCVH